MDYLLQKESISLKELSNHFKANEGYLNVAFRILASQGFLNYTIDNQKDEIGISINSKSEYAFSNFHLYEEVVKVLEETDFFISVQIESTHIHKIANLFEKFRNNFGITFSDDNEELIIQQQILKHIEGYLVAPIVVSLGMTGMFHKYFMETSFRAEEFHKEPEVFKIILNFFSKSILPEKTSTLKS